MQLSSLSFFRAASCDCLGAGRKWISLPVTSGCFSTHQQVLGTSSPCRLKVPSSFSKCLRPNTLKTADHLLFLSTLLNLFPPHSIAFIPGQTKPLSSVLLSCVCCGEPLPTVRALVNNVFVCWCFLLQQ